MNLPSVSISAVVIAIGSAFLVPTAARAVPVAPGGAAVALPGTTSAARPELAGVVLEDVVTAWESAIDPTYGFPGAEGQLQSRVVRETSSGTLDFYWRVTVNGPSYPLYVPQVLALTGFSLADFATGATFDADYRLDGTGTAAPVNGVASNGSSFSFNFSSSTFGRGSSSYFLLLHSNAVDYDASAFATLGVTTVSTFAPTAAVPEPATWALLVGGLGLLGAATRHARATRQGATD